jgi:hypothetical protein
MLCDADMCIADLMVPVQSQHVNHPYSLTVMRVLHAV